MPVCITYLYRRHKCIRGTAAATMAELGDLLSGGSTRLKGVGIEMLDYNFLDTCTDPDLIRSIVRKLKSGEEGHYPDLLKHAETRLLEELPEAERIKILRMKAEPRVEEIFQATNELHDWEDEMAKISSEVKDIGAHQRHAPGWTSRTEAETESRPPRVVELPTVPKEEGDRDVEGCSEPTTEQAETQKLSAYDFRAWEKYNADEEIKRLEGQEEEEERRRDETITSTKVRAEQDEQRRTKKREAQLKEAGQGRFKESLSSFEKKRVAEREHLKGNESFKAKEFEEAFRCYTLSLALDDTNAKVYNNRAAAAHKMERFDQAEDDCTRAIYLDPKFKRAWMRRGVVRHSRGKYAKSVADFTEALHLDPNDKHAHNLREHSQSKQHEVEGETTQQAEKASPMKRGRVLIEEVDTLQDYENGKGAVALTYATPALPPPVGTGGKRAMVGHGRMGLFEFEMDTSAFSLPPAT